MIMTLMIAVSTRETAAMYPNEVPSEWAFCESLLMEKRTAHAGLIGVLEKESHEADTWAPERLPV